MLCTFTHRIRSSLTSAGSSPQRPSNNCRRLKSIGGAIGAWPCRRRPLQQANRFLPHRRPVAVTTAAKTRKIAKKEKESHTVASYQYRAAAATTIAQSAKYQEPVYQSLRVFVSAILKQAGRPVPPFHKRRAYSICLSSAWYPRAGAQVSVVIF